MKHIEEVMNCTVCGAQIEIDREFVDIFGPLSDPICESCLWAEKARELGVSQKEATATGSAPVAPKLTLRQQQEARDCIGRGVRVSRDRDESLPGSAVGVITEPVVRQPEQVVTDQYGNVLDGSDDEYVETSKGFSVVVDEFSRESVECPACGRSHEREWPDVVLCACGAEIAVETSEEEEGVMSVVQYGVYRQGSNVAIMVMGDDGEPELYSVVDWFSHEPPQWVGDECDGWEYVGFDYGPCGDDLLFIKKVLPLCDAWDRSWLEEYLTR